MHRLLAIIFLLISSSAMAQSTGQIADGQLGGACRASGTECDEGICDQGRNICVSCGLEGQAPCIAADGEPYCTFPSYGYRPEPLGGRGRICITRDSDDCGQIGLLACDYGDGPVCRSGVVTLIRGGTPVCGACGDYGQPCCPDTAIPCDYGTCQAGVCLPDKPSAQSAPAPAKADKDAILAAIRDCRLSEARTLHAGLDGSQPWYEEVTHDLTAAIERENAVSDLYDQALAIQSDARRLADRGDATGATRVFQRVEQILRQAKAQSRCDRTIAVITEAIAINARNMAAPKTEADLDLAAAQIGLCKFDEAGDLLDAMPDDTPGRAALLARLDAALDRESRVMQLYDAAKNLHDIGHSRLLARDYKGAAEVLADARQGFLNARQLTQCTEFRDTISEAIAVAGRNLDTAQSLADADRMPQRYSSGAPTSPAPKSAPPKQIEIMPQGAHPCLDAQVPTDAWVSGYTLGMGGGGQSFAMKGPFICGFNGRFTVFDGGSLTNYFCKTEGRRYVDCRMDKQKAITSEEAVHDGYVYRYDDDKRWIVVSPAKK